MYCPGLDGPYGCSKDEKDDDKVYDNCGGDKNGASGKTIATAQGAKIDGEAGMKDDKVFSFHGGVDTTVKFGKNSI